MLLSSRLPREPSRLRLGVWRRLRRLGALLVHDAVWVLPADARTREACEWLAEEIEEQGGTVWIWEAGGSAAQDRTLVELFRREADARYAEIAASAQGLRNVALRGGRRRPVRVKDAEALSHALRQLRGLERALRLEGRRDFFRAEGRRAAVAAVAQAMAELEAQEIKLPPSGKGVVHALGD